MASPNNHVAQEHLPNQQPSSSRLSSPPSSSSRGIEELIEELSHMAVSRHNQGNLNTIGNSSMLKSGIDYNALREAGYDIIPRYSYFSYEDILLPPPSNELWVVESLRREFLFLAKDPRGCTYLQRLLEAVGAGGLGFGTIFAELRGHVRELAVHPFGNQVLPKLLEFCSEKKLTEIVRTLTRSKPQFIAVCVNEYGCLTVKKVMQLITAEFQMFMVAYAMRPAAAALTMNANAHRLIEYCVMHFPLQIKALLLDVVVYNCLAIATNRSGCCFLQQCLNSSIGEFRSQLTGEIAANASALAEDPYGNYVVQYLLDSQDLEAKVNILQQLRSHFATLSRNKYGSNVVEKCLTELGSRGSFFVVDELLRGPDLPTLFTDPFGNYVIQRALILTKGIRFTMLVTAIRSHSRIMRNNIHGRRVIECCNELGPLRLYKYLAI